MAVITFWTDRAAVDALNESPTYRRGVRRPCGRYRCAARSGRHDGETATSDVIAGEGARVVVAGRRAAEGERLVSALGGEAAFARVDVTHDGDVAALFGRLDAVVNCAGQAGATETVTSVDLDRLDATVTAHLKGTMKHAAPSMVEHRGLGRCPALVSHTDA